MTRFPTSTGDAVIVEGGPAKGDRGRIVLVLVAALLLAAAAGVRGGLPASAGDPGTEGYGSIVNGSRDSCSTA
jgi:hypothetical protein